MTASSQANPPPPNPVQFDLVVPLFNEESNVERLIGDIDSSGLIHSGLRKVVLLNNHSADGTGKVVDAMSARHSWIIPVTLPANLNYGGGIYEAYRYTSAPYIGAIPGDNQVHPDDVAKVWQRLQEVRETKNENSLLVKGCRTIRLDGFSTRLASRVYTALANSLLGLGVRDVNGLPKIFHRSLLDLLPAQRMITFTFDAQLIDTARRNGWRIEEVPVSFLARRAGVSSWSGKRFKTYRITVGQLFALRKLRDDPPVPLKPVQSSPVSSLH